jgi:hypothetical protein
MKKTCQELILDLIESEGEWNAFDGARIAAALRDNRSLWRAVVLTDGGYEYLQNETGEVAGVGPELRALGGLLEDNLLYDVIRAVPKAGKDRELEALFESMGPDSVRWFKLEASTSVFGRTAREEFIADGYNPEHAILEAWWD